MAHASAQTLSSLYIEQRFLCVLKQNVLILRMFTEPCLCGGYALRAWLQQYIKHRHPFTWLRILTVSALNDLWSVFSLLASWACSFTAVNGSHSPYSAEIWDDEGRQRPGPLMAVMRLCLPLRLAHFRKTPFFCPCLSITNDKPLPAISFLLFGSSE